MDAIKSEIKLTEVGKGKLRARMKAAGVHSYRCEELLSKKWILKPEKNVGASDISDLEIVYAGPVNDLSCMILDPEDWTVDNIFWIGRRR